MPGIQTIEPTEEGPPKLTAAEFKQWHEEQEKERRAAEAEAIAQRRADLLANKIPVEEMTGKELHEFHPELFDGY